MGETAIKTPLPKADTDCPSTCSMDTDTPDDDRTAERLSAVGGFTGAVFGARGGPVGALVGGTVGGAAGYLVGRQLAAEAPYREEPVSVDLGDEQSAPSTEDTASDDDHTTDTASDDDHTTEDDEDGHTAEEEDGEDTATDDDA